MSNYLFIALIVIGSVIGILAMLSMMLRVVVGPNEMHIVQSRSKTTSYGKDQPSGNVYWRWPMWVPVYGVRAQALPVSIFNIKIDQYHAYDKDRVPFLVDIIAFFRITDSNTAAQRLSSITELLNQLQGTLRGAVRTILATHEIHEILEGRSKFGQVFTEEVDKNLREWGIQTVKMIELMDIQDAPGSKVIDQIMAKKKSAIEMDSRTVVAGNIRQAQVAEIEAEQLVAVRRQEQAQIVGERTAEQERQVGVAKEQSKQTVLDQTKVTAEKDMMVKQVQAVRAAEIARQKAVIEADQAKQVTIVKAEGDKQADIIDAEAIQAVKVLEAEGQKQQTTLVSEGDLAKALNGATGIEANGKASAEAARLMALAPVAPQIALAKEIGENKEYQQYLLTVRDIEAKQAVGTAQAEALVDADVKIIVNSGNPVEGAMSVMDLFSPKGGTAIGAALEAFKQTPTGAAVLKAAGLPNGSGAEAP